MQLKNFNIEENDTLLKIICFLAAALVACSSSQYPVLVLVVLVLVVVPELLRDHAATNLNIYCTDFSRGAFLVPR